MYELPKSIIHELQRWRRCENFSNDEIITDSQVHEQLVKHQQHK